MIWDAFMFRDEFAMLDLRLEEFARAAAELGEPVTHVAVEARWTHRGVPKKLELADYVGGRGTWAADRNLAVLEDDWDPDPHAPWVNEHHQRNRAWEYIDDRAGEDDWVLIGDVDEIPSRQLLKRAPGIVHAVPMRTYLFAVDLEVAVPVPPACIAARVWWLRGQARTGCYLAEARDGRGDYPVFGGFGGWHFSWVGQGGPVWQAAKLDTATCHTEILGTEEAARIRSGDRHAGGPDGGGLKVRPVDVDRSWPAYIADRRCPAEWFRPDK